jgi:chemotaxis protein CheX
MTTYELPQESDLWAITEMIWASYLDPLGEHPLMAGAALHNDDDVHGSVSVTGAWDGQVVVSFSQVAAQRATAALLGVDFEEVSSADVMDAVGELVNIIGGSVKSLMPQPTVLSLPSVRTGPPAELAGTETLVLAGTWMEEPVSILVLESADAYAGTGGTSR